MSVLREGITAGLTADIIEKLKVNGITRVTDLISKELEEICQLASISYKVIIRVMGFRGFKIKKPYYVTVTSFSAT